MWLDNCRIPFVDADKEKINFDRARVRPNQQEYFGNELGYNYFTNDDNKEYNTQGRFTPNLLVCDDMLNDGSVSSIKQNKDYIPPNEPDSIVGFSRGKYSGINDKGTNSRYYDLDKWFDKIIDEIQ
jgi:hypothetical protein